MKNGSYFIPREQSCPFLNPGSVNNEESFYIFWETDPTTACRVLPPPLELVDPEHPSATVHVVNIQEPTFAPWYMDGGISLVCRYGETAGVYILNLQLSGPSALMGAVIYHLHSAEAMPSPWAWQIPLAHVAISERGASSCLNFPKILII